MSAWGHKIKQDDYVCDVVNIFNEYLKINADVNKTTLEVIKQYSDDIDDEDDGPLFWIALAESQWEYNEVQKEIYNKVEKIITNELGLELWKEGDRKSLLARKKELNNFLTKVKKPNLKPKKYPKIILRKPKYREGDCLSIKLESGQYAAAIVLIEDESDIEHGQNLIAGLTYLSHQEPEPSDFLKKNWLLISHNKWDNGHIDIGWYGTHGHRKYSKLINVVSTIRITTDDPATSSTFCNWLHLGEQAFHQKEREKEWSKEKIEGEFSHLDATVYNGSYP